MAPDVPLGEVVTLDQVAQAEGWDPARVAEERAAASLFWTDTESRRAEFRRFGSEWTDAEIDEYLVTRRRTALDDLRRHGIEPPQQLVEAVEADAARSVT